MSETDHSSDLVETILQILTNIKPPDEKIVKDEIGKDEIVEDEIGKDEIVEDEIGKDEIVEETNNYDSGNLVDTVLTVLENINSPTPSSVANILENLNTESYDSDILVNTILEILNGTSDSSGAQDDTDNNTGPTGTTGNSRMSTVTNYLNTKTQSVKDNISRLRNSLKTVSNNTSPTGVQNNDTTGTTGNSRMSTVTNYLNTKTQSVKDNISRLRNSLKTVSNNSEFISIVNKTMRKIDSRCDLVALIHLIETLLARKPENKLTADERTFYENILKLLKDKLYIDTANKDRQYPLTISLSEIVDEVENKINMIDVDNPTFKTNDFDPKLTVVDNLSFFRQILRPSIDEKSVMH